MPVFQKPPPGQMCQWNCGALATHYCNGCGKWICSGLACLRKSVALGLGFGR